MAQDSSWYNHEVEKIHPTEGAPPVGEAPFVNPHRLPPKNTKDNKPTDAQNPLASRQRMNAVQSANSYRAVNNPGGSTNTSITGGL